jgi:hypothetical protein
MVVRGGTAGGPGGRATAGAGAIGTTSRSRSTSSRAGREPRYAEGPAGRAPQTSRAGEAPDDCSSVRNSRPSTLPTSAHPGGAAMPPCTSEGARPRARCTGRTGPRHCRRFVDGDGLANAGVLMPPTSAATNTAAPNLRFMVLPLPDGLTPAARSLLVACVPWSQLNAAVRAPIGGQVRGGGQATTPAWRWVGREPSFTPGVADVAMPTAVR